MNKKGFTLIEVILAIALVMIVSTIVISNMTDFGKDIKQNDYDNLVKEILLAAEDYANSNAAVLNYVYGLATSNSCECSKSNSRRYVTAKTLVDSGYIRGNNSSKDKLIDPRNNNEIGNTYYVTFCHNNEKLLTTFCNP